MSYVFVFVMLIIMLFTASYRPISFETFADDTTSAPDYGSYGSIDQMTDQWLRKHTIRTFKLPLNLSKMTVPSNNEEEIKLLKDLTATLPTRQQTESIIKYEKYGVVPTFVQYCKKNGLKYKADQLRQIDLDIKKLTLQLKQIYNRQRPFQVGIKPYQMIDCHTPSYPSYRTCSAFVLADYLTKNNGRHKNDLQTIAKEVEMSRIIGGYNYPSDTEASRYVADIVSKSLSL